MQTAKEIYQGNRHLNNFADWFKKITKRNFNLAIFYLGLKANARVNQGRWIVDCPFCNGAEALWPGEPWFLCGGCKNNDSMLALKVVLPEDISLIEKALEKRTRYENRNWSPGETIRDLEIQNKQKGVI